MDHLFATDGMEHCAGRFRGVHWLLHSTPHTTGASVRAAVWRIAEDCCLLGDRQFGSLFCFQFDVQTTHYCNFFWPSHIVVTP